MMVRRLERFDERFFLYCEDTELCKRLRRHGRIVWVPSCVFKHDLGASSQKKWEAVARYNRGKDLYFSIHHGRLASLVCFVLNRLGALGRMIVWGVASIVTLCLVGTIRQKFVTFLFVLFAPIHGPAVPHR